MDLETTEDGAVRLSVPTLPQELDPIALCRAGAGLLAGENDKITRVELIVRSAVLRSTVANKPKGA